MAASEGEIGKLYPLFYSSFLVSQVDHFNYDL